MNLGPCQGRLLGILHKGACKHRGSNPGLLRCPDSPRCPGILKYVNIHIWGDIETYEGGVLGIRRGARQGRPLSPLRFGRQVKPRDKPLFEISPFSLVLSVSRALEVPPLLRITGYPETKPLCGVRDSFPSPSATATEVDRR